MQNQESYENSGRGAEAGNRRAGSILKERDSWWTVLVIDPIAVRLTYWFADNTSITPNIVSAVSLAFTLLSSYLFYRGFLWQGALIYEVSFLFDCIDGKLARLQNRQSAVGYLFDRLFDKFRLFLNTLALGYHARSLLLPFIFVFLYLWQEGEGIRDLYLKKGSSEAEASGTFRERLRRSFARRRLVVFPNLVEADTLVFFVGPLIKRIEIGFILGIAVVTLNILKLIFYSLERRGKSG